MKKIFRNIFFSQNNVTQSVQAQCKIYRAEFEVQVQGILRLHETRVIVLGELSHEKPYTSSIPAYLPRI